MKHKTKSIISLLAIAFLYLPSLVLASSGSALVIDPGNTGLSDESIYDLAENAMYWLLGAIGILSVIAFAFSGVLYLTAAGDEDRTKKAKSVLVSAITGIVVAMVGLIVVNAIHSFLSGGSSSNQL